MVTRGKVKAGGAKRTTMRVRPSVVEQGGGSQQAAPGFEAASTAARKREVGRPMIKEENRDDCWDIGRLDQSSDETGLISEDGGE